MRSEWIPVSASALITGGMALVLAQLLNPAGGDVAPAESFTIAADSAARWFAMSVLFFVASVALILGMPAVVTLFTSRRGRGLGLFGVALFTLGCVGVAGIGALMLFFRSLAVHEALEPAKVGPVLGDAGLTLMLNVWVYGFLGGVLVIALALLRSKQAPTWIPLVLLAFLGVQVVLPLMEAPVSRLVSAVGLMTLAIGLTGIAVTAAEPRRRAIVAGRF